MEKYSYIDNIINDMLNYGLLKLSQKDMAGNVLFALMDARDRDSYKELGRVYLHSFAKYKESENIFSACLNKSSDDWGAFYLRGQSRIKMGKYDEGISDINTYIEKTSDKEALFFIGMANLKQGRFPAAIDNFADGLEYTETKYEKTADITHVILMRLLKSISHHKNKDKDADEIFKSTIGYIINNGGTRRIQEEVVVQSYLSASEHFAEHDKKIAISYLCTAMNYHYNALNDDNNVTINIVLGGSAINLSKMINDVHGIFCKIIR